MKKSIGLTYLFWLFGFHFAYLERWGLLVLYWFTLGGLGFWAFIELMLIPGRVDRSNNKISFIHDPLSPESSNDGLYTNYVQLVGVSYRKEAFTRLRAYDDVILEREPENPHDQYAVKVINQKNNQHLGYIASEYCAYVSNYLLNGGKYDAFVMEKYPASAELNVKMKMKIPI